jgi:hypothetical protein
MQTPGFLRKTPCGKWALWNVLALKWMRQEMENRRDKDSITAVFHLKLLDGYIDIEEQYPLNPTSCDSFQGDRRNR